LNGGSAGKMRGDHDTGPAGHTGPALESPLLADEPPLVPEGAAVEALSGGDGDAGITLSVEDLLPAADGSVIFDADVGVTLTDAGAIRDAGTAPADARAGGQDVGGYQFVALETGLTLYYPPDAPVAFTHG
jgi:hypothetical protein